MKKVADLVELIDEELEGAKCYAEKYVEFKSENNMSQANRFKEMAMDELKHATYIHEYAITIIDELKTVFVPPVAMQEKWDKSHKEYVERTAWVKQMLAM